VFYHACQSAVGHIFFKLALYKLLTYLLTYLPNYNNWHPTIHGPIGYLRASMDSQRNAKCYNYFRMLMNACSEIDQNPPQVGRSCYSYTYIMQFDVLVINITIKRIERRCNDRKPNHHTDCYADHSEDPYKPSRHEISLPAHWEHTANFNFVIPCMYVFMYVYIYIYIYTCVCVYRPYRSVLIANSMDACTRDKCHLHKAYTCLQQPQSYCYNAIQTKLSSPIINHMPV